MALPRDFVRGQPCNQSGVALAIVVWFIAGMSLLVAGIVSHARVDTQMTQLHVARAKAAASGDGAIRLLLAEVASGRVGDAQGGGMAGRYRLGALTVEVQLVPVEGLIDLNSAPAKTLSALFVVSGAMDAASAQTVANNVVKWRQSRAPGRGSSSNRFAAPEDILRIDGVSRAVLDAVRDYVVAGAAARGTVNWSAAPAPVRAVLQRANPRQAAQRRTAGARGSTGLGSFRADALLRYGGRTWLRRVWVANGASGTSMLPWHRVRTEPPRITHVNRG